MPTPKLGYFLNGKRVPSVSTILGTLGWGNENLLRWAANLGLQGVDYEKSRQGACDVGTCAHDMIDCHLHGRQIDNELYPVEVIEQALPAYAAFRAWAKEQQVSVIDSEFPLVSAALRYGGTPDALVRLNRSEQVLLDFKTSKWLFPKHVIQVVAYMDLIAECRGTYLDRAIVLRVGKDGEFKTLVVEGETVEQGRKAFYHLLELYKLKSPLEAITRKTNTPGAVPALSNMTMMGLKVAS
jgi:hypothetical protein